MGTEIILQEGCCNSNLGKVKYVILAPIPPPIDESKLLDPITEDAEFEIMEQPKIGYSPNA